MNHITSDLLYKYRGCDINALRILANKELYFAAPETLNDPLDCQLPVVELLDQVIESEPLGKTRDLLSKLRNLKVTNRSTGELELLHRTFEALPTTTGVLSLSRNATDALLWSHYSNGHRGFCIGFDAGFFSDLITNWKEYDLLGASDVSYAQAPPFRDLWIRKAENIEAIQNIPAANRGAAIAAYQDDFVRDFIVAVLATKSKDWEYEREYRAVKAKPGAIGFPPTALREIAFGLRSSKDDQTMIRTLLDGPEWKHVCFRHAVPRIGTFALMLVEC